MIIDVEKAEISVRVTHEMMLKFTRENKHNIAEMISDIDAGMLRSMQTNEDKGGITVIVIDPDTPDSSIRRLVTDISLDGPWLGGWLADVSWRHMPGGAE